MKLAPLAALALLAACAAPHDTGPRMAGKEGPQLLVPFYADRRDQWGPAALASVLGFWGKPTEPEELRREIHFPKQRGSTALDLRNAAAKRGLEAEMSGGSLAILRQELDAGRPVLVFVNNGVGIWPDEHFMVVTGYNDWLGGVYAHWGPHPYAFLRYKKFEKTWEKTGRWMLFISQPAAKAEVAPAAACVPIPRTSIKIDSKSRIKTLSPVETTSSCAPVRVIK
jgi:ABC-type bacteriocin/lantibiotic exporter with double-glycine peptidase domain